jgi:hypothetical protein
VVNIPLQVPEDFSAEAFEAACSRAGLQVKRLTLAKFPGGLHCHLSKATQKGTLEATWWNGRFWFSVHENRKADWHAVAIEALRTDISGS